MRRDDLYITDMIAACSAIDIFLTDIDEQAFLAESNDLLQSAVLQKLTIIGEAASRVTDGLKGQWPDIPWRAIAAFRNIAVHAYFTIDWPIVWTAATVHVPELRTKLLGLQTAMGNQSAN